MADKETISLRNILVMVVADGAVTEQERELVDRAREKAGIDAAEFNRLCQDVRDGSRRLEIPIAGAEAEKMLRVLLEASAVDGEMAPAEQRLLERVGQFIDRNAAELEAMAGESPPSAADAELESKINDSIEQLYAHFAEWTPQQRRSECEALGNLGSPAVIPLLKALESYREPEGGGGLQMKEMIVEQLAAIGDDRVVYYLAQQVSLGDTDDEVTCTALREAAADAIGKIAGKCFTRDEAGVRACREWWAGEGTATYRTLVL